MDTERRLEILGILIISLSVFILVSLTGYNPNEEPHISPNVKITNPMGIMGLLISYFMIKKGFGFIVVILPITGIVWGWFLFSKKKLEKLARSTFYISIAVVLISVTIGFFSEIYFHEESSRYFASGLIGGLVGAFLIDWLSPFGSTLFLIASFLILIRSYFNVDYYAPFSTLNKRLNLIFQQIKYKIDQKERAFAKRVHTEELKNKIKASEEKNLKHEPKKFDEEQNLKIEKNNNDVLETGDDKALELQKGQSGKTIDGDAVVDPEKKPNDEADTSPESGENLNIEEIIENEEVDLDDIIERKKPKRKYQLPSSDLLENPVKISDSLSRDELVDRANYLTQSMSTFGVDGKVVNVHPGPVITLFEVEPAEGVRVNKFVQLADDLARVMEASSVRVIAPIPGKSSVGIEIPNRNPETVFFKSVVNSTEFAKAESLLTLAIGKTTTGEISTLNLAKMPHLLIAGTTGSGKSVCINTIICSILYSASPDEVKFVMIDPKKVEMTLYKKLEGFHLLKMEDIAEPIVTSVDNSILALRALEREMDRRYNVLADSVVRNIDEYNSKMKKAGEPIMPFIVLVVDELADLMMLSAKDVEAPIARLAQLARAVGIHLVIATQRPSVDVITGVIKANFPSRIAFQVASKIDSRTIIDQPGADKLIGRGDMLHLGTGSSDVFRMHNAFLTLNEIDSIMDHVVSQPKPDELVLPTVRDKQFSELNGDADNGGSDELFNEAVALVITHQQGSISLLQRRLKVGYSRAARLIDQMEQAGVVGPFTGSKAREVLVDETYLEMIRDS